MVYLPWNMNELEFAIAIQPALENRDDSDFDYISMLYHHVDVEVQKKIVYTYLHKLEIERLAIKSLGYCPEEFKLHDTDKMLMCLMTNRKRSRVHRVMADHHSFKFDGGKKFSSADHRDLVLAEILLDLESCQYSKPDKTLNAYGRLRREGRLTKEIFYKLKSMGFTTTFTSDGISESAYDELVTSVNEEDMINRIVDGLDYVRTFMK